MLSTRKVGKNFDRQFEDNHLRAFRFMTGVLVAEFDKEEKIALVKKFFKKGSDGKKFLGDAYLWIKFLAADTNDLRCLNYNAFILINIFAAIFGASAQEMISEYKQTGELAEVICKSFHVSPKNSTRLRSDLCLRDVDELCSKLSQSTTDEEDIALFQALCEKATLLDLKTVVNIVTGHNNVGLSTSEILEVFDTAAYHEFQKSGSLEQALKAYQSDYEQVLLDTKQRNLRTRNILQAIYFAVGMAFFFVFFLFLKDVLTSANF